MAYARGTNGFRAQHEAYLGNYPRFHSYLTFYHEAFEALMKDVAALGWHVDRLAFPMLFIARHCLELGFKYNIRHFKKYSKLKDFSKNHDLRTLFGEFKQHIEKTVTNLKDNYGIEVIKTEIDEFNLYCREVDKLTLLFDTLDKGSFNFRYPEDQNDKRVFKSTDRINLLDVEELLKESMVLLQYTSSVFSKYTDQVDELENLNSQ